MKTNKIMVPLDGSELAESALADAFDLVRPDSGVVVLMRAVEAHVLPGGDQTLAQVDAVAEAEKYLADLRAKLGPRGPRNVETHVWYGPPTACIIEAASAYKPDVIVMTSHGRSGVGRLILGSVAESVLRGTTVPILLRRPSEAPVDVPAVSTQPKEILR
ncbi:MAG TPA: universal stress protein [Methylomirabilota bacterium]|jgi:nucleotide-binding universal stress UspA family protein